MTRNEELAVTVVAAPVVLVFRGGAIMLLWNWFVAPLGAPMVGFAHAVGLGIFLGFPWPGWQDPDRSEEKSINKVAAIAVSRSLFAIVAGWIVHLFM